jgi:hypothetical protein
VLNHYQAGTIAARLSLFGIHFDIGFCRPIPSNVNLKKERPVCISFTLEGHGGEVGWGRHVLHHYQVDTIAARLKRGVRVRKIRIKGEKKDQRNQLNKHLRHGNSCCAPFVTKCILHGNTGSQPNGKYFFFTWSLYHYNLVLFVNIISRLVWRCAAVGCWIVDGWVDHWCTDVSWVWWIPNRNAGVLPHNNIIRNNRYYTTTYDVPNYYTEVSKYNYA